MKEIGQVLLLPFCRWEKGGDGWPTGPKPATAMTDPGLKPESPTLNPGSEK